MDQPFPDFYERMQELANESKESVYLIDSKYCPEGLGNGIQESQATEEEKKVAYYIVHPVHPEGKRNAVSGPSDS